MRNSLALLALMLVGCGSDQPAATPAAVDSSKPTQAASTPAPDPQTLVNQDGKIDPGLPPTAGYGAKMPKDGDPIVIMTTNRGRIVLKFFPSVAPNHVSNFLKLAGSGFYDGTKFHRVIPHFMIQGGDPNTKGSDESTYGQGGPGYTINAEFNPIEHQPGILSMARTSDPNGAGSQFFIVHERSPSSASLDNQYTVFGQVIEGMDVVNKIVKSPRNAADKPAEDQILQKAEVTKWPIPLQGVKDAPAAAPAATPATPPAPNTPPAPAPTGK